jgi:L-fuculose-phosphate aldolase
MKSELSLKKEILQFAHLCYERNLLVAMDGNLSVKLPDGNILCTQAGCHKGLMTEDQLVIIDKNGKKLRGKGQPTSEMAMHLACYAARPDIKAVIHAHPPTSIAFTIASVSMAHCVLPEVVLTLGTVPTLPYATTGTESLAEMVGETAKDFDAMLMDRHGAVCLGSDLLEAFCRLETMEHTANITKMARDMGQVKTLPPEEASKLRKMGLERYGGPPRAVAKANTDGADLPDACLSCSGCGNPEPNGIAPSQNLRFARILAGSEAQKANPKASLSDMVTEEVLRMLNPTGPN